jgi:hypothetical protein
MEVPLDHQSRDFVVSSGRRSSSRRGVSPASESDDAMSTARDSFHRHSHHKSHRQKRPELLVSDLTEFHGGEVEAGLVVSELPSFQIAETMPELAVSELPEFEVAEEKPELSLSLISELHEGEAIAVLGISAANEIHENEVIPELAVSGISELHEGEKAKERVQVAEFASFEALQPPIEVRPSGVSGFELASPVKLAISEDVGPLRGRIFAAPSPVRSPPARVARSGGEGIPIERDFSLPKNLD